MAIEVIMAVATPPDHFPGNHAPLTHYHRLMLPSATSHLSRSPWPGDSADLLIVLGASARIHGAPRGSGTGCRDSLAWQYAVLAGERSFTAARRCRGTTSGNRGDRSCATSSQSCSSGSRVARNLNWADRALLATLLSVIPKARRRGMRLLVTPDTILRWHRDLVRRRQAARSRRGKTGSPATRRNIRALVLRLAQENPEWGYLRSTASWPAWE